MRRRKDIEGILFIARFSLVLLLLAGPARAAQRLPWPRRPGVILCHLRQNATAAQRTALAQLSTVRHSSAASSAKTRHSYDTLVVPASAQSEEDLAQELRATGAVDFAEPDYLLPAAQIPNDPQYAAQWYHPLIGSPAAWDVTRGTISVTVAVCDTGIDASHPDLAANLSLPGINSVDGTTNTSPIADHGTTVAGVLGAVGNNGVGGTGIAWTTRILPVRVTNNTDSTAWCSDMASGIEWASDHGAKVINLSYDTTGCPATIDSAARYARSSGALVFVAAGNSTQDLSSTYPAVHSFLLISATDASDHPAGFSNFGTPIDLAAPGVSIWAPTPNNGYASLSGTSFSSPMAAGAAALLFSLNPALTPDQVQNFLFAAAKGMGLSGKDPHTGHGRLDVGAAVRMAQSVLQGNTAPVVQIAPVAAAVWPGPIAMNAAVQDDGLPTPPGAVTEVWSKVSGPGTVVFSNPQAPATSATFSYAGTYTLELTASDGVLSTSRDVVVSVSPQPDGSGGLPAPVLDLPSELPLQGNLSASFPPGYSIAHFEWTVQPQGAQASNGTSAGEPGVIGASWSTTDPSASLSTQALSPGLYSISVRAYDNNGVVSPAAQATVTLVQSDLKSVRVFPNPWRADRHQGAPVTFDQLAADSTITIFTVSGHKVRTLGGAPPSVTWDLTTDSGDRIASGLYLYLVNDGQGQKTTGKLAVIR